MFWVDFHLWQWCLIFSLSAIAVFGTSKWLVSATDTIGEHTGLSKGFLGAVMLATATSLPEIFTGISAVTLTDSPDLPVGTVFGSNMFNLMMFNLMINKLKKGGLISISLPTDPGLLWRIGRLFTKYITIKKSYNISTRDFEYMMASEHINSIFNLITIIRYNFKGKILKEDFLPFKIKLIDINLFYNVHIVKS